jgi:1,4-dihydroxy-2-naphthoate polyprenyltransferase
VSSTGDRQVQSDLSAALPGVERPRSWLKIWWLAARPKTLLAAATPVLVGSACAHAERGFALAPAVAALVGALLLQIAANFANDVFDYEKGADTRERIGPTRVVQAGWVSPRRMRWALAVVIGLALLVGVYLVSVAGPLLIAIGVASIIAAIAYTGGPYPLGYHGLGDVFVLFFFGFVAVAGTHFVQTGDVSRLAWLSSIPVGCLATGILVVNNVRDAETDALAGKRTLAVRFGRRFGVLEYRVLLLAAYGVPLYLMLSDELGAWAFLPWLTAPIGVDLSRRLARDRGPALNAALARTAQLLFLFGALSSVSIVLDAGSRRSGHVRSEKPGIARGSACTG